MKTTTILISITVAIIIIYKMINSKKSEEVIIQKSPVKKEPVKTKPTVKKPTVKKPTTKRKKTSEKIKDSNITLRKPKKDDQVN